MIEETEEPRPRPGGHHLCELHDVPVNEEEPPEPMVLDQAELLLETALGLRPPLLGPSPEHLPLPGLGRGRIGIGEPGILRIVLIQEGASDLGEHLHRVLPVGILFGAPLEVGEDVAQILREVESGTPLGDPERAPERVGAGGEAPYHLLGRGEVELGVGAAALVRAV